MDQWDGKSKGTPLGYQFFIGLIKIAHPTVVYGFMGFIVLFYFIFSNKKGILQYHRQVFKRRGISALHAAWKSYFEFGRSLIDRVAIISNTWNHFKVTMENEESIHQIAAKKKGGILISAHVGNWEIAHRYLKRIDTTVHILMFDGENPAIKSVLESTFGELPVKFIFMKEDLSHIMAINEAFARGEIIAMHGDRYRPDAKNLRLGFFGEHATFPIGPFLLADKFKVPVLFTSTVRVGKNHYHFQADPPVFPSDDTNRAQSQQRIEEIATKYVSYLEKLVKKAPYQWYNFYPFWN